MASTAHTDPSTCTHDPGKDATCTAGDVGSIGACDAPFDCKSGTCT